MPKSTTIVAHRVALVGGDRVDDPIGADFLGILVEDRHPGFNSGADHQRRAMKIALGELLHHLVERRHHARDRNAFRLDATLDAVAGEQRVEQRAVLVGGAIGNGRDAPVIAQALAFVNSNHGMAVANVNRYQHDKTPSDGRRRKRRDRAQIIARELDGKETACEWGRVIESGQIPGTEVGNRQTN